MLARCRASIKRVNPAAMSTGSPNSRTEAFVSSF